MFRVVALGYWAGEIIDRLRATDTYDDIRFVFCDTDERQLMAHGNENDEYILLTDIAQCREAIHDDNELMAVLVTTLCEDCSLQYASEIMYELWNYADRTYCFATIPFYAGGKREAAMEVFKTITYWSDISVAQDMLKMPDSIFFIDYYDAIAFAIAVISHLLIKQLSYECGYNIASLRERIYYMPEKDPETKMAGILIYTASGDAEGTLGG